MILMAGHDLERVSRETGLPVEQIMSPVDRHGNLGGKWICDNGAFVRFQEETFLRLLERNKAHRERCRFVVAPDVVGSARRTLEVFPLWQARLFPWPIALVAQDGIEELPIPWDEIQAIFIGGTTAWKNSDYAMHVAKAAKILGKWVHVGRINTPIRMERWKEVADSCDGSGLTRFSHMRLALKEARLFDGVGTSEEDAIGAENSPNCISTVEESRSESAIPVG
jgi:hypothetical protein